MGGVQTALVAAGMWNLAAFSAGLAGLAAGLWLARRGQPNSHAAPPPAREVLLGLAGYALLVGLILVVQLVAPLRDFLSQWALRVGFPAVATSRGFATPDEAGRVIRWLTHPGTLIALAAALVSVVYRRTGWLVPGSGRKVVAATARRTAGTTLSVVSMVSLAVVMQHAGMTAALASGLAAGLGAIYPAVAPWIGALGAFITGSNTNANVLFTALQQDTALLLGLPVAAILAAQTAGGAVASVLAPTKIVVGAATVGMEGKEGPVMRSMAPYILGILFLMSAAATLTVLF
jgi:lactate permease